MDQKLCVDFSLSIKKGYNLDPKEMMDSVATHTGLPGVIVLAGPTAVGKSHLAIQLAKDLGGEIVSADSMQVYKGMDIGTAKPSIFEQEQIPHYMIDIREVSDPINVAQFCEEAMRAIRSIAARGRVPIVVGGSGFYIDAILRGPPSGPPADPFVRAHFEGEMERLGAETLYDELVKLDPSYAHTITHADRHKIVRALEIIFLSKMKVSDFSRNDRKSVKEYQFLCYFLHRPRPILYDRINQRCVEMVKSGLIQEVRSLLNHGLLDNPSAAHAIGYRQTLEFLKKEQTPESFDDFMERFCQASRHYAKRQFTWFRKDGAFEWLDLEAIGEKLAIERIAHEYQAL